MAQNITLMGASYTAVPAVTLPKTGGGTARYDDASVTTAIASDVTSGKVFLLADGTITTGTNSGGGGASNFVTGTFTTPSTTRTNGTVTVPYTGTGYPIALIIFVEGGCYNPAISGWYNSLVRYSVGQFIITKSVATIAPSYGTSETQDYGTVQAMYKNSTSYETTYSSTRSATANSYSSSNANGTSITCVRWISNTRISYRTGGGASSSYGLLADTTYRYIAVYSQ